MKKWLEQIIYAFIESVLFSGSVALAIFLGYGLFSWNWGIALYLGAGIWLVFFMVIFCGELLTGMSLEMV